MPVGARRRLRRLMVLGVVVAGDEGYRCAVLTATGYEEVHRALLQGASNLRLAFGRSGEPSFTESGILGEMSRHLPRGFRMGRPRPIEVRDVHGSARIRFSDLVGGRALDDEVEVLRPPAPAPASGPRLRLPTMRG